MTVVVRDAQGVRTPARVDWKSWTGRVFSALPVLMMLLSASMKLLHAPAMATSMVEKYGYPPQALTPIGVIELLCVVVYVVPKTAVLGAVLLTGYLGGAIATHVRIGEAFPIPALLGVAVWLGLFLRDARLRALLPLRATSGA
jgi:DoxX-like family